MINERIRGEDIITLKEGERDICISIIVPTYKILPGKSTGTQEVDNAVRRAKEYLRQNYLPDDVAPLMQSLDKLSRQAGWGYNACGIGIFVSANVEKLIRFSCPVKEKIIINSSFEIRDLLYQAQYSRPYYVLHLGTQGAEFYQGGIGTLKEVGDKNFPRTYCDTEQNKLSGSAYYTVNNSTQSFEGDKLWMEDVRFDDFLKKTDKVLAGYVTGGVPLMVSGAKRRVSAFANVTGNMENIVAYLYGNHRSATQNFHEIVWTVAKEYLDGYYRNLGRECIKLVAEGKAVYGIKEAWKAVMEGRGTQLFVEKDFTIPGFLDRYNRYDLHIHPPRARHHAIPDAVDNLIEQVLKKSGKVILLENKALLNHQRIALVTTR